MERNWFALRNFHCHWFEDSGVLDQYLHFQTESLEDHLRHIEETIPVEARDRSREESHDAIKKAVMEAKPVLLEPIVDIEITVPGTLMGDITGDLNGRRGRILGMDSLGDMQIIRAQVPLGEVSNYSTELKSITGGEGSYTLSFSHYDVVPSHVAQQVAAKAKKDAES